MSCGFRARRWFEVGWRSSGGCSTRYRALPTPRVVAAAADGHDLCLKAPGEALSWREWELWSRNTARICPPFGRFLAALHEALPFERARELGVPEDVGPAPGYLYEHLSGRLETRPRQRLLAALLEAAPVLLAPWRERVLLHDDLSLHNVGFDRASGRMVGIFDFGSCAIGDPHRDLRYDPGLESKDESAVRAYEEARGMALSRGRQRAWHAWSALDNLAWSLEHEGHDPELQAARWGWVDSVADWDLGFLSKLG